MDDRVDFFISYNKADLEWATWTAWTLEAAGYTTLLEAWDFQPGANFALEMQSALVRSERMIAVLSADYLRGVYASSEWAGVYATDPQGFDRRLVPVKVRECEPDGLLRAIIHIDLVGQSEEAARARLLSGVSAVRNKPLTVPAFPGPREAVAAPDAKTPGTAPSPARVSRLALTDPPDVSWRTDTQAKRARGALVEVHLVSVATPVRISTRTLRELGDSLAAMARAYGLFAHTQAIDVMLGSSEVTVFDGTSSGGAGLLVTAAGQRGGWVPLPHDVLGAVLDEADVATRVAGLLRVLVDIDLPGADRVALAIGVEPASMVVLGKAPNVGRRSGTRMNVAPLEKVRCEPRDSLSLTDVRRNAEEVSAELAARVITAFAQV